MTPAQLDLLSAAIRHVRDAERLLAPGAGQSVDQAWHLAGFGPECVRKACLADRALDRPLGHDLGEAADALLDLAVGLDPHAMRYRLLGRADQAPQLAGWRPDARYERTGQRAPAAVAPGVHAAAALVDRVVADLWADGAPVHEVL